MMPDYPLGQTLDFKFTTRAFATGAPTTLAGTPAVAVYEDNSLVEITAGITLTVDFDSRTGLNNIRIVATGANGYEAGKSYSAVITTGTVGGVSVIGEVVAQFTIERSAANANMRGTDNAALAADWTSARAGYLDTLQTLAARGHDATVLAQIQRVISVIESQRGAHTHQVQGDIFFVDPVNGNTHASGNRGGVSDPYNSVQDCHDNAVTDSQHDLIILLAGNASGVTTLTEDVTLSKRYLFIRGPGRDFIWTRSGSGNTISVTADGIELSGFQVGTAAIGSGNGVQLTDAEFLRCHNIWFNDTQGDGVNILRGTNCIVEDCFFTDTGQGGSGQGIHIVGTAGTSNKNIVRRCGFRNCAGDGILISDGTTNDTVIRENVIEGSSGWGVNIGASSTDAVVIDNRFGNNTSGAINDGGTATVAINNEQWATGSGTGDWTTGEKENIRSALGVDGTKTAATGGQLQDVKAKTDNLPATPADETTSGAIKAQTDKMQFTGSNEIKSDLTSIGGDVNLTSQFGASINHIYLTTVNTGVFAPVHDTSDPDPNNHTTEFEMDFLADPGLINADGLKGRVVMFDRNTATIGLRTQAATIVSNLVPSPSGTVRIKTNLLTSLPVQGDLITTV